MKSTVAQIKERFDNDVERFSNLDTGQSSTVDATVSLDLVTNAAAAVNPTAQHVLDIGCGAGNYTLRLLQRLPNVNVILIDLSYPMLMRALQRIGNATSGTTDAIQGDIREVELGKDRFDIIMAAAVFHHLREVEEWEQVFTKCYASLKPGGSLWISDLIEHSMPGVQSIMWNRYGNYLSSLKDSQYRDYVFSYIEQEDSPRPLSFQLDLLRRVGFRQIDLLHKNSVFAAFGAVK